jgi:quinoprotein relay system zinc metallohydrolase 2
MFVAFSGALAATRINAAITQIAPGDFVRPGVCADATPENQDGIANTAFIVGDAAVAVIDPGGSLQDGNRLRTAIRATTALPIRFVIMTHGHPDHVFGATAFLPDHPVYVGHWRLPAILANRAAHDHNALASSLGTADTGAAVLPTRLVHDRLTLDLGHRVLVLEAYESAHTDADITVFDRATATLFAGDLLFSGRIPALDGSLRGWLRTLDALEKQPAARVVPGHGPAALPWPQGAADEHRYLAALLHDVRHAIAAGQDIDAAATTAAAAERPRWALFDAYNGRNAIEAYKELQWE